MIKLYYIVNNLPIKFTSANVNLKKYIFKNLLKRTVIKNYKQNIWRNIHNTGKINFLFFPAVLIQSNLFQVF